MTAKEKLLKARSLLILDHPFFGCLAVRLKLEESKQFKTLATNGKKICFNPSFIKGLADKEIQGVLAHEVMHLALGHHWRQDNREAKRWNLAGDYAINGNLLRAGLILPSEALSNPDFDNLATEEIYERLAEEEDKKQQQGNKAGDKAGNKNGNGNQNQQQEQEEEQKQDIDPGGNGAVLPTKSEEEAEESKAEWKVALSQALQISQGTLTQELEKLLGEALDPPLPWYILLRDFVERTARNDYSWSKPSRKYFSQGIILPSLISEELPEIVIAIDTSGSIDEQQLAEFGKEVSAVLEAYSTTIKILYCDSKVQKEEEYSSQDLPLNLKPVGGGGTRFAPVFEHIERKGYTPACLLYFTDLYGSFPPQQPEYPVMWISTSDLDKKAPFGEVVRFQN